MGEKVIGDQVDGGHLFTLFPLYSSVGAWGVVWRCCRCSVSDRFADLQQGRRPIENDIMNDVLCGVVKEWLAFFDEKEMEHK